jgi:hypothetical protein
MVCVNKHRPSKDGMWATCWHSASSGYYAEFHDGCYQNHTKNRYISDISVHLADFHEGNSTVGEWSGRDMVCVN